MGMAFPEINAQARWHFSPVEIDKTPIVEVFCVGRSFTSIKRSYRKLALMVHSDHVAILDRRGSSKSMTVYRQQDAAARERAEALRAAALRLNDNARSAPLTTKNADKQRKPFKPT